MPARRSSMCSAPTQRNDSGGSPPSVSGVINSFTTGPRTVDRMVARARPRRAPGCCTCAFGEFAPARRRRGSAWVVRIHRLAIQVAGGGGVVGDGPGGGAVAAPPHAGEAGMAGAGGIIVRAVQRVFVPTGWHPERLVRIAAQHRVAGAGAAAVQRPVVAAGRVVGADAAGRDRWRRDHEVLRCLGRQVERAQRRSGSRRAASAAAMRSMRPFNDHQMPRPIATTSRTVKGAGA